MAQYLKLCNYKRFDACPQSVERRTIKKHIAFNCIANVINSDRGASKCCLIVNLEANVRRILAETCAEGVRYALRHPP